MLNKTTQNLMWVKQMNFESLQKFSTPSSLQGPLFSVPKVAVVESFKCNYSEIILLKVYIEVKCV